MSGHELRHVKRRIVLLDNMGAAPLRRHLQESGYDAPTVGLDALPSAIVRMEADAAIIVLPAGAVGLDDEGLSFARRLRREPATSSLPVILVHSEHEQVLRHAALSIGVDDYFGIWTPREQVLARLDVILWRKEVERRAAYMSGDQRLEIDNFVYLLDSLREDARNGDNGTIALIYAAAAGNVAVVHDHELHLLSEAHGFFKLNLRRMDVIGFYGPTTLLVYLPGRAANDSFEVMNLLRKEFSDGCADRDLAIGLASFPSDGRDVESLIDKADAAARIAIETTNGQRVVDYSSRDEHSEESEDTQPAPRESTVSSADESETFSDANGADTKPHRVETATVETVANAESILTGEEPAIHEAPPVATIADVAARERERRASGTAMPRRLLLTMSDPARIVQLNALVRAAGYEARTAFDGQQALDLMRIEQPDLLLLDYDLKDFDGLEMLRRLRKQSGGQLSTSVIMLLPPMNFSSRFEALELGARMVIPTPYDPRELLDSIRLAGSNL